MSFGNIQGGLKEVLSGDGMRYNMCRYGYFFVPRDVEP